MSIGATSRDARIAGALYAALLIVASVHAIYAPIALFEPESCRLGRPHSRARGDVPPRGKFLLRNPVAGEYLLATVTDVEQGEWFDPAFLEQLARAAIKLPVAEGEKKVQDIRIAKAQ